MQPGSAWRLFISIPLPEDLRSAVTEYQQAWKRRLPHGAVRWTPQEQLHLTLRFLGDVPVDAVPMVTGALKDACTGCAPLSLNLAGPGAFPDWRRPRVIWLGLTGSVPALNQLQERIRQSTRAWGKSDDKAFHPHLTLGRVVDVSPALGGVPDPFNRVKTCEALEESDVFVRVAGMPPSTSGRDARRYNPAGRTDPLKSGVSGNWLADEVHLMRSVLSPQGASHTCLSAIPLHGATTPESPTGSTGRSAG